MASFAQRLLPDLRLRASLPALQRWQGRSLLPAQIIPGPKVIDLLRIMRRHSDFLVLTGGEPLQHPDFPQVLGGLKDLRFRGVLLTTNGLLADRFLDEILRQTPVPAPTE